jgi:hypothetical protein
MREKAFIGDPDTLAGKLSRRAPRERSEQRGCEESMARVFAVMVQILLSITRIAPRPAVAKRMSWGTSLIEAGKLSRYRIFIGGTGAVSRYNLSRSQKSVTMQDLNCGQMSVSGCNSHYKFVLGARVKVEERSDEIPPWRGKNHDEPINYTVRVMLRHLFFCHGENVFMDVESSVLLKASNVS